LKAIYIVSEVLNTRWSSDNIYMMQIRH